MKDLVKLVQCEEVRKTRRFPDVGLDVLAEGRVDPGDFSVHVAIRGT